MVDESKRFSKLSAIILLSLLALFGIWLAGSLGGSGVPVAEAAPSCVEITSERSLIAPTLINFDSLPNGVKIGDSYRPALGVSFENDKTTIVYTYGNEPARTHSTPNVATNVAAPGTSSANIPMRFSFDTPKSQVGFYLGNGSVAGGTSALLVAYNSANQAVCRVNVQVVPNGYTLFEGISTGDQIISSITIDYGNTALSEAIDDLYFSPGPGVLPTRTPVPTWTPVPTLVPTVGSSPTPTAVVPLMPYLVVKVGPQVIIPLNLPDYSIHGIEITQGIQCFDTSKGLAGCADNSQPVVDKKDTTARIYIKANNAYSLNNNIPVRLHLRANGVWYQADTVGRATTTVDQAQTDSANIYFNVNFSSAVAVDFYAEVDPDNLLFEVTRANNRYPTSGYLTLTFQPRRTLTIVGERLRYHPGGYGGSQYAGGWAVNGGAADWWQQVLPISNNGIHYSINSGYLDWTTSLGSGDGQHSLIQSLNALWILQNAFSFWFSGPFIGANHVYGWAPSAGYSGGHADMPVYPHAGGLGVVGIGSDAAGTNTDNPGSGALIFGHELTHDYNVYHTNTSDACGSNDPNSNFPYANSSIQEFGFNPFTGKIYNPSNTHDLMSYCPSGGSKNGWISPFTWTTMFNKLAPTAALSAFSPQSAPANTIYQSGAAESLQVNASIFNPLYTQKVSGALGNMYRVPVGLGFQQVKGPYAIEMRDGQGTILASYPFDVSFLSEYSAHGDSPNTAPPFPPDPTKQDDVSFLLPWLPNTTTIALTWMGNVLDTRSVSANPPQVLISSPSVPDDWLPGSTHALAWQGLDLDGDTLTYAVFYSNDAGASWSLLQDNISASFYDLQTDSLAGGSDVRLRVVATDGVNTGFDETHVTLSVPNKKPEATILNPIQNIFVKPDELVVFQGIGVDLEDGTLPDEALTWSSNRDGSLGIGPSLPINTLGRGKQIITLTVTDSLGVSASADVTIFVGYPSYIPVISK